MLGVIAEKLQFQLYETVGQFVSDVELVFADSASPHQVRKLLQFGAVRVSEPCSCVTGCGTHRHGRRTQESVR